MLTLVFLKLLSDLGLYYSFAGFFAIFAGADASFLLISLGLQAVAGLMTWLLREKRLLRFLPLFLLAVCFALPGGGYAEWLVIAPPSIYIIYLTVKGLYLPEWSAQVGIFQIFWKILLTFCALALLMGCWEQLSVITVPAGLIALTCCVILMRSLRHDASVYCTPRFQMMNLVTVAVVMLVAAMLSSDAFLGAVLVAVRWFYQTICYPVIMVLIYLLVGMIGIVIWLFSWITFSETERQETEIIIDTGGVADMLEDLEGGQNSELFMQVLTALGVLLAAAVIFCVFRWLSRSVRQRGEAAVLGERTTVERMPEDRRFFIALSPTEQVRTQYRKYLKLCRAKGFDFERSETSQEIETKTRAALEAESVHSMRGIYIEARYHENATKEDAAEAKRLYQRLAAYTKKNE